MSDPDLLVRYNYASFTEETYQPWMRFASSPPLGEPGPDFPLWPLADDSTAETTLHTVLGENKYTIVEFGSFT